MAGVVLFNSAQILKQQSGGILAIASIKTNYSTSSDNALNLASLKRGTGGRSSFNGVVATVFGATGFVGRYVCNKLGKQGTQIIIPYRGDSYDSVHLKPCGDLGQVLFQPYHLRDAQSIERAVRYSNVVINLVGRDWETKNFKFKDVHVDGARLLAKIAKEAGVKKFIHVSALNASEHPMPIFKTGGSEFLKSKLKGEEAVRKEFPDAIIFRPADVYGQEDRFLRYYAHGWRRNLRFMPLWKNGTCTVKQPVYISDLAAGIVNAIHSPNAAGNIYQAVGPKRYYLSDLVDWFYKLMRKDEEWGYYRYDLRYDPFFQMKIKITDKVCPGRPVGNLHPERVEREYQTDQVDSSIPTLEDLGVNLMPMEHQVPWELKPFRALLYYDSAVGEFETPADPKVCTNA